MTVSNLGATNDLTGYGTFLSGDDAGNFTVVTDFDSIVAAGGSVDVDLTFDPSTGPGTYTATLELDSDDTVEPTRFVTLTAEVPHDPIISVPSSVVVGPFPDGSGPQSFTIQVDNLGAANALVLSPAPVLSDETNFSIDSFVSPIAAGANGLINLTFDPLGASGTFQTTLTIESNDAVAPSTDVMIITGILPASSVDPMLHYAFEEGSGTTANSLVNPTAGNTLNLTNPGTDTDWENGPTGFGKALQIKTAAGLAEATDPASWAMPLSDSSMTMAFWVNLDGGAPGSSPSLAGALASAATSWRHHYMIRANSGSEQAWAFVRGLDGAVTIFTVADASTSLPENTWTHVATTLDAATGELIFYIDGFLAKTETDAAWAGWPLPSELTFSGVGNPNNFSLSGLYDDIRVYDATLSQVEILALMTGGNATATAEMQLAITGYNPGTGILSLTATGIPAGQTFHLEGSTDLQSFGVLASTFDFDSTTPQPFEIPVTGPVLFLQAFDGPSVP